MPAWSGLTYQSRSRVKGFGFDGDPLEGSSPPPQAARPSASDARHDQRRQPNAARHVRVTPRLSQVTTLRSISETSAKRTIAITESSVIAANIRAVSRLLEAIRI